MEVWRRHRETASAGLSAALYSVYSGLYGEAVVSSVASAVALAEVGRFREAVQYVQKAAKALYEAAKEVFERVKVTAERLVELFVEAVARVLAWVDEHRAYLFLMAAVAAGVIALSVALNLWGLVELEKLAHAASAPFVAGLADAGGKAAERFKTLGERYEKWKMDEKLIEGVLKAPLRGEKPYAAFLKLTESRRGLPPPLVESRRELKDVKDEVVQDAAVVAALVLYKPLVKNAEAYREWAELYKWARGMVERQEFTVTAEEVERLRGAHRRLEEVAEEVKRELNAVLTLYASHSRDLYERLRPHLEVDVEKAEKLAEVRRNELSNYSGANMGTKAYAALLSVARGGIYGHAAMLLVGEGALADIVLSTPEGVYQKAWRIAKGRGEAVDPSRMGAAGWEDRAASALLRYLLGRAVSEDLMFRRVKGGFEVFRAYGGIEARVDVLKIGESAARSKAAEEVLRRFVEEAKRTAPDLSGIKKIWQALEWLNTDASFTGGWIVAATAHLWQLRWYFALFGEPELISGGASVTEEGVKPNVTMYWRRERLDSIIAEESSWLKPLLGRAVSSWRELVDAIEWRRVLKRVEELADTLKAWIGSESANDAEREGRARRMLGELALFVHFAEARRGKSDDEWREERVKRLARAVEALSGGRIAGDHANELAGLIISYAESRRREIRERIYKLAEKLVDISKEEVWSVVDFVLSDMYCLARDCARDKVMRKFVAPALELTMLDKALRDEFDREEALLIFGEMYATAVAGDGTVGPREIGLTVGGELGGGVALLRLAALYTLSQLLSNKLEFNTQVYAESSIRIAAYGEDAAKFMRFLAVCAPSAGGEYLSEKFEEFMKEARVEVRPDNIRLTESGRVTADLIISEVGVAVKYNVYLSDRIELEFQSTDRSRVELAALLLKLAGVDAEMKKVGGRDKWYVRAYTRKLAAGHKELRKAIAEFVREALARGWIDASNAEGWLEELENGITLMEGWPRYHVGLDKGALVVRYHSTNPDNIEEEAQRLREMGLVEGVHFSVKMPEGGGAGYVSILRKGLEHAAWLSVHGKGERQRLAAEFVEYILQRAREAGEEVYEKVREIVEEGKARGSLTLKGFEKEVEVDGKKRVVKVIDGGAEFDVGRSGKLLLRIRITAEVGNVRSEYTITYGRYGEGNAAMGRAYARTDVPGGREADAERFSALVEALTGKRPRVCRMKDGKIMIECYEGHLEGFARYAELANAIMKWLKETSCR
jgi:Fe2+ transport system protein FeoA